MLLARALLPRRVRPLAAIARARGGAASRLAFNQEATADQAREARENRPPWHHVLAR
jgi:hypothetical protein